MDGSDLAAAQVTIWWDNELNITRSIIVFSNDIPLSEAYPILLEELTQSLGFMNDISNPTYRSNSVFSEDSNQVTKLGTQDIMAIMRHYPPF